MKKCFQLFITFFKIGAFTLGGGYAMLSMIENAVVRKRKWIDEADFWDLIAVVQAVPGVFAVNTALYIGHKIAGVKGALFAMFGAIIPSFFIILVIAMFFKEYKDNQLVESIFKGIRPCVVALILAPSINMIKQSKTTVKTVWIPILTIVLVWFFKVSPIYIIVAVIVGSLIYAYFTNQRINRNEK